MTLFVTRAACIGLVPRKGLHSSATGGLDPSSVRGSRIPAPCVDPAVPVVDLVSPSMVIGVQDCAVVVVVNVHQSTLDYASCWRAVTRSGVGARRKSLSCC
jgi:hypothetical protein